MNKHKQILASLGSVGTVARHQLERMGALLDSQSANTSNFRAVDLSTGNADEDAPPQHLFRDHTIKASEQLIGRRFAVYGKYLKKVVPNRSFDAAVDGAFAQLASLASSWSRLDLPNQRRFSGLAQLDEQQRHALATDIANQNRALATLGGVTGLAGFPGLLADTLWLLLVSLRSIYQLAAVYDQPLTGKQGIKMAYQILGSADLSKMQEKQTLLAALAVGKSLADNAASHGLHSELKNLGVQSQNISQYAAQIDKLAEQLGFDLDNVNTAWARKLIPVGAVAVGMHYNRHLIDQVLGVAKATFAPEPKLLASD